MMWRGMLHWYAEMTSASRRKLWRRLELPCAPRGSRGKSPGHPGRSLVQGRSPRPGCAPNAECAVLEDPIVTRVSWMAYALIASAGMLGLCSPAHGAADVSFDKDFLSGVVEKV